MALPDLRRQSVQELPQAKPQSVSNGSIDLFVADRGPLLSAWGTRQREEELRRIYRHDYNWMIQGAFAGIMKLIASTPLNIIGPDNLSSDTEKYYRQAFKALKLPESTDERPDVEYWKTVLNQADFGRGWGNFVQKGVDYLRQDAGWFWEIIAPGPADKEPRGPATGIAHLDSLRCIPSGDPEYPVYYVDRHGKIHRIHRTRVVQIVDMPDGDERYPGYGLCALSRAVSIASREILMGRYIETQLDDLPPPGIVIAGGLMEQEKNAALSRYRKETTSDQPTPFGRQLWLFAPDPALAPKIETVTFSTPPEKFDFQIYTELDVNALALAIGVDVQDLWQLTGGTLGSGEQSEILNQKSRGKTVGTLRNAIESAVTNILPDGYSATFDYKDAQEDQEKATTAKLWADAVSAASPHLDDMEARRILAETVEQFGEQLKDKSGEVAEREPPAPMEVLPNGQPNPNGPAAGSASANGKPQPKVDVGRQRNTAAARTAAKQFQATRLQFEDAFSDYVSALKSEALSKVRARIVGRALLNRYGLDSIRDGLKEGGVDTRSLDDEDRTQFAFWLAEQNSYLSDLIDRVVEQKVNVNPDSTADMWANKSIQGAYNLGLNSANRNGMFEFGGPDGEESCLTCKRLKGQRHRMKSWTNKRLRPGVDTQNFKCGGWHCHHTLTPTDQPAYGRF